MVTSAALNGTVSPATLAIDGWVSTGTVVSRASGGQQAHLSCRTTVVNEPSGVTGAAMATARKREMNASVNFMLTDVMVP